MTRDRPAIVRDRRTQAERRETSGRGLVQAAVAVVAEQGVSAATFQAIGTRSGYHRSLVTQRFGGKQGLTDAVIEYLYGQVDDRLRESHVDDLSGLQAVLTFMDLYLQELARNREMRAYFQLLSSAVAELSDLRTAFAAQHERVRQRLAAMIARGQADGSVNPGVDGASAGVMIGGLQLGLAMQLLVDPHTDLEAVRRTSLAALRASLSAD